MILTLISLMRYIISGLFIFYIFNDSKNSIFTKVFVPSVIYSVILIVFKIFIIDNPIIAIISTITIFGCLTIIDKSRNWKASLTYSLFTSCLLEYSHFLIFKLISIIIEFLGIPEVTSAQPERLLISRIIALILYAVSILLIYKFAHVDVKLINPLSNYPIFPIFLSIALGIVIYLKYYIKYTHSNEFHNILSIAFVFLIVLSLIFIFSSKTFLEKIENFQTKKINPAIEEAKLQKGNGYSGLKFQCKDLISQMEYFKNELSIVGIDIEDDKAKQLLHCAVLFNQEEEIDKVNMISGIYSYTAEILGIQPKSVETNISNLLKDHWATRDSKVLKLIEDNYHAKTSEKNGAPTPREFLRYLVKRYREDLNKQNKIK